MIVLLAGLPACRERTDEHIGTVTERQQQRIDELKSVLCSAPNGWRMKYFPNLNSRLNTDITENYKTEAHSLTDVYLQRRMGAGGYNLFLKFREGGEMDVLTDIAYAPADVKSHYQPVYQPEIGQAQYGISVSDDLTLFSVRVPCWKNCIRFRSMRRLNSCRCWFLPNGYCSGR